MENNTLLNEPRTPLLEIFSLFVSDDKYRPLMHSPFEINGKVYATDAYSLIRTDKENIDFVLEHKECIPRAEEIIPIPNCNTILNIDKSIFEQFLTEDEYETISEDIECSICNGFGEVEWEFSTYTKEDDCPACEGSGYKTQAQAEPTGRKNFGAYLVKLNDAYFCMHRFYKLVEVSYILGEPIVLIYQGTPLSANLFKIGFCEILLMTRSHFETKITDGLLIIL